MKTGRTTPYHLMGLYYNDVKNEVSGRVCLTAPAFIAIIYNYEEVDSWTAANKGRPAADHTPFPATYHAHLKLSTIEDNFTASPLYPQKPLAFLQERGIVTSVSNDAVDGWKPSPKAAPKTSPKAAHVSSQRAVGINPEEEIIMAKTAALASDLTLIAIYDSGKAAKTAHKGQSDVVFVVKGKFPENGIGEFKIETDLFPADPVPEKAESAGATRTVVKREGEYHVVKADGLRAAETDPRMAVHKALMGNTTFEAYFEAAPKGQVKYTSARGAEQFVTASSWAGYALKRGWIALGPKPAAEPEASAEQEAAGEATAEGEAQAE